MKKKLRAIFTSLKGRRPPFRFCPLSLYSASNPGGTMGRLFHPSSIVFHLSLPPLIPLCLSFELYPLNLQLWGAAGMRDTFSRKFARRILKPRGKQDQYLVSQEEGTRRVLSVISHCPLVGRPVVLCAFLPLFLPARRRIAETWEDNTLCRKGRRDIASQRRGLLWFVRSRKGSS